MSKTVQQVEQVEVLDWGDILDMIAPLAKQLHKYNVQAATEPVDSDNYLAVHESYVEMTDDAHGWTRCAVGEHLNLGEFGPTTPSERVGAAVRHYDLELGHMGYAFSMALTQLDTHHAKWIRDRIHERVEALGGPDMVRAEVVARVKAAGPLEDRSEWDEAMDKVGLGFHVDSPCRALV